MQEKTELPVMDDSFTPANSKSQPQDGRVVDLWHCNGIVRGYKENGSWKLEYVAPEGASPHAWKPDDRKTIVVDGWRYDGTSKDKAKTDETLWPDQSKPAGSYDQNQSGYTQNQGQTSATNQTRPGDATRPNQPEKPYLETPKGPPVGNP